MSPYLIFSLKRSGSTTLMRLLNALPGMRCMREPFNANNYGSRYHDRVADAESLSDVLREIWTTHDGIKHVWESDGWPFRRPELNARLVLEPGQRVVFLRRRNVLQRIVSLQISEQANVWSAIPHLDRERLSAFEFAPLNADVVRRHVESESALLDGLRDRMIESGVPFMEAWYEDLYDAQLAPATRRSRADAIVRFLGREPAGDPAALAKIDRLLDPLVTRLNSEESYARIPRIAEIEAACGANETGWLFR
jgi:LPS sulfotransferase NodH